MSVDEAEFRPGTARGWGSRVLLFFKGMAMGAADSVPGVSGGTIAFITNIYEELIHSLKRLSPLSLAVLYREGFAAFWQHVNGAFLLTLLLGIASSLLLLANLVIYLLDTWPQLLMSFFSGLVLASAIYLGRNMPQWRYHHGLLVLAGLILTLSLGLLPQAGEHSSLWYFFLCGAVAICAMILPGISGAFILLLLGAYTPVLQALRNLDMAVVSVFIAGCIVGLLSFANVLSWLFRHYRAATMAFLLGVLLGSLYSIWPWQEAVSFRTNSQGLTEGVQFRSILPGHYEALYGTEARVWLCGLLALSGLVLVLGLEAVSAGIRKRKN